MKLVTFEREGKTRPGVLMGERVVDLAAAGLPDSDGDLLGILRAGPDMMARAQATAQAPGSVSFPLGEVRLRAPVFRPGKIVGIGLNYIDHCREAKLPVPEFPLLFAKFPNSVIGPDEDIVFDRRICAEIDYEVELGVVMGARASRVDEARALDYVAGYTIAHDVSARDLQFRGAQQWDHGKSIDTFCPWGPYVVTKDEIPDPQALDMRLLLNGRELQSSNTGNMIFSVAQLVSFISQSITLEAGDLIVTGTPFGVGFSRQPPIYLKDGDECVLEISGLGRLRNRVREVL
ncbi:fumarylacetoacetate hydrolase family protein [Castellaniella sp. GW247-6E4]|uniref:fumarylacetoacetate hydrolase family protein n=1 Tax=Castellaniella sp. GW247-6E4 TaxID=3140380 RepID=UPI003315CB28